MTFKREKVDAINERLNSSRNRRSLGIELTNSLKGTGIVKDHMVFAEVDELGRLIEELQMLKSVIEDETGLDLDE